MARPPHLHGDAQEHGVAGLPPLVGHRLQHVVQRAERRELCDEHLHIHSYGLYGYGLYSHGSYSYAYMVMAYIVVAYVVVTYIAMAYIVMAHIVMAYKAVA